MYNRLAVLLSSALGALALAAGVAVPSATADPDTGFIAVLDCGSTGTLAVTLDQFGGPLFAVDSTRVLVPKEIVRDGVVVFSKPGIEQSAANETTCSFTNPRGTTFVITGILTPASG